MLGAVRGLREEVVEQVVRRRGEEGSGIWQAEEGEGNLQGGPQLVGNATPFPMAGFCFVFLALVHRLLRRMYYNDHMLVWHHGGHLLVRRRPPNLEVSGELWAPLGPQVLQQYIAALQPVEESENEEETADEEDTGDELGTEDEEGTGDEEVAVFETSTQLAENPQEESEWAAAGEFSAGPPFQRVRKALGAGGPCTLGGCRGRQAGRRPLCRPGVVASAWE